MVVADLMTSTGKQIRITDEGEVYWVQPSGMEHDSEIRIPKAEYIHNKTGVAAALRAIADHLDE